MGSLPFFAGQRFAPESDKGQSGIAFRYRNDRCYYFFGLKGDCRNEVVVWDPFELWVYTQDDNPMRGRLYKPQRNPLYNYSNYQATVSVPGWTK